MSKWHIQMFSIHGLIRPENLELGRDADTGGQTKYVVDLARALGEREDVTRVDLFTRLIDDKRVSSDYKEPVSPINDKARIIRVRCGGKRYFRKELLWPYLDEFVDNVIRFNRENSLEPDLLHGHYADAGYVARKLSQMLNIPYVFTGHSLGRSKQDKLSAEGMSLDQMDKHYNILRRIQAEENVLKTADLVVTSTTDEIEKQYALYDNFKVPDYTIIPPGIDIDTFYPYYYDEDEHFRKPERYTQARHKIWEEFERFFKEPRKPLILAICRPDSRKNIQGLVTAYGDSKELQVMANLAVFAGIRKDIDNMDDNERQVLTELLMLMDKYDLYGKMALPKKHDPTNEVPELYRMGAYSHGVFVNSAFTEPFGLTLIEAASTGLPVVGPNDGGPHDIIKNCRNGVLVDTTDPKKIAEGIKEVLIDSEKWTQYSNNGIIGVRNHYSWHAHAETYLQKVQQVVQEFEKGRKKPGIKPSAKRFMDFDKLVITDIDNTLIGDQESLRRFLETLQQYRDRIGFGVATGRNLEMVHQVLGEQNIPTPDVIISSVGTEIYYGPDLENLKQDENWSSRIAYQWKPQRIKQALRELDFLKPQEEDHEREFKLSYTMSYSDDRMAAIHKRLSDDNLRYQLIFSHDTYVDIIPQRASKGKAIDYLCRKWNISPSKVLVAGDSGNDHEMLTGSRRAVVVGNHSPELEELRNRKNVYFAEGSYAAGILEGLRYYAFLPARDQMAKDKAAT